VSPRITLATARRVLWQIRRDRRTIALLLVVPVGLLVLMRYVFDGQPSTFQAIGAPMCGLFPFSIMFLLMSIAMLRERTSGTLERLMSLPVAKTDLLAIGNAVLGMALGLFVSAFARTEFQAVQFMPAIIFPQLLLCGLFVDRHEMAGVLYGLSSALLLTYAYDALARATHPRPLGGRVALDVAVILGATLIALTLGALTLRRRTA
jgi:ABC-2 type transport system permease protein